MCKFAFKTYEKILLDLRTFLRGGNQYNHEKFINEIN